MWRAPVVAGMVGFAERTLSGPSVRRRLHRAEARFRNVFDNAPIGMTLLSLDIHIVLANAALGRLLGYRPEELQGRPLASITHPEDRAADQELLAQLRTGELDTYRIEKRYLSAAGEPIWVSIHGSVLRDADGRPVQFLAQVLDISEWRATESHLRHLADHDQLTGLLNRRGLEAALDRQVAEVNRHGERGALLILDIDHLKLINDTLGHAAGDELIVAVAGRLRAMMRATDTVARLGGDEFAVLLGDVDAPAARRIAEQIVRTIGDTVIVLAGSHPRRISASAGVTLFREGLSSGEEVLINADLAMYEAKLGGRDRAALFFDRDSEPAARIGWVERIRLALSEDRFRLYAQPIVGLASGRIHKYELLVRMLDDRDEPIAPEAFIYIAERQDLIQQLDRWVIREAIAQVAREREAGRELSLAINLSGKTLGDPQLPSYIENEIAEAGIAASALIFEVTETTAIANIDMAVEFARRLRRLGCRFALDDFGSGFGSFYYLKHIPFDYLKIDSEFITRCIENHTDQLVIRALVGLARGMDKATIAEGVEQPETAAFLRAEGIDFAQGFHLAEPRPLAEVLAARAAGAGP